MQLVRADHLLSSMPPRGRALSECALVSSLLFLPGLVASLAPASALAWVWGGCFSLYAAWAAFLARRRWNLPLT